MRRRYTSDSSTSLSAGSIAKAGNLSSISSVKSYVEYDLNVTAQAERASRSPRHAHPHFPQKSGPRDDRSTMC